MSKPKIDMPLDESELGNRDAFHVPVVAVKSSSDLEPGQPVTFYDGTTVAPCSRLDMRAIVNPWMPGPGLRGTVFWVPVAPNLVKEFSHTFEIEGVYNPESDSSYDDPCSGC